MQVPTWRKAVWRNPSQLEPILKVGRSRILVFAAAQFTADHVAQSAKSVQIPARRKTCTKLFVFTGETDHFVRADIKKDRSNSIY